MAKSKTPETIPLAAALDAERERQGLTDYRLAKDAGISAGRLRSILHGDTPNPGINTVRAILAALGKPFAWLDRQNGE